MSSVAPSSSIAVAINACVRAYGASLEPLRKEKISALAHQVLSLQLNLSEMDAILRRHTAAKYVAMKHNELLTYEGEMARLTARFSEQTGTYTGNGFSVVMEPMQIWRQLVTEEKESFKGFLPKYTCQALIDLAVAIAKDGASFDDCFYELSRLIYNHWVYDRLPLSSTMQRLADSLMHRPLHITILHQVGRMFLLQFGQEVAGVRDTFWLEILRQTLTFDDDHLPWIEALIEGEFSLDAAFKFYVRLLSPDLIKASKTTLHALGFVAGMMTTERFAAEEITREWDPSFMATQLDVRMLAWTNEPPEDGRQQDAIALHKGTDSDAFRTFLTHAVCGAKRHGGPLFNHIEREELLHPIYRGLAWSRRVAGLGAWRHKRMKDN